MKVNHAQLTLKVHKGFLPKALVKMSQVVPLTLGETQLDHQNRSFHEQSDHQSRYV